jgi:hypothetical protein
LRRLGLAQLDLERQPHLALLKVGRLSGGVINVERLVGPCGHKDCVMRTAFSELSIATCDVLLLMGCAVRVDCLCVWRQHGGMSLCMLQLGRHTVSFANQAWSAGGYV